MQQPRFGARLTRHHIFTKISSLKKNFMLNKRLWPQKPQFCQRMILQFLRLGMRSINVLFPCFSKINWSILDKRQYLWVVIYGLISKYLVNYLVQLPCNLLLVDVPRINTIIRGIYNYKTCVNIYTPVRFGHWTFWHRDGSATINVLLIKSPHTNNLSQPALCTWPTTQPCSTHPAFLPSGISAPAQYGLRSLRYWSHPFSYRAVFLILFWT